MTITIKKNFQTDLDVLLPHTMTSEDFFALAEKRKRDAAGSGVIEWGQQRTAIGSGYEVISEGLYSRINTALVDSFLMSRETETDGSISRTRWPLFNVNGISTRIDILNRDIGFNDRVRISFPPAPDGTVTYDSATGDVVQHASSAIAFASETATNKVVISRQDYVFLEVWHELVSDKDIVVPLGNVQYGATDYEGITLVGLNTIGVAQGYSAFGNWDTATQGNGSQWSTLSDGDKVKYLQDEENNIYWDEEVQDFIQVRYRIRTIAGAGNGDWVSVAYTGGTSSNTNSMGFTQVGTDWVRAKGQQETITSDLGDIPAGTPFFSAFENTAVTSLFDSMIGTHYATDGLNSATQTGYKGQCFAVNIAFVQRLNTGIYEPSYNPMGTDKVTGDLFWYESPTTVDDTGAAFLPANKLGQGNIGNNSGRTDGQFYDPIYAAYVQDLRMSSLVRAKDEIREE